MEKITVQSEHPYDLYIGKDTLGDLPDHITTYAADIKKSGEIVCIVTDRHVARYYLKPVSRTLKKQGFRVKSSILIPGERVKAIQHYHSLLRTLAKAGCTRDSLIVALGGGVIGDLAGFAAATYMRGVRFVQVPTSLLAQVDSSIGGKVGIDLKEGKNLVGSFHSPLFVLADPAVLTTLDARQFVAGLGEVIKSGLIFNEQLFNRLYKWCMKITNTDTNDTVIAADILKKRLLEEYDFLTYLIIRTVKVKKEIVETDERENELRMILNFGHTFGHAVEMLTNYRRFLHGEAVIVGMKIAVEISCRAGMLSDAQNKKIQKLLDLFGLPQLKGITAKKIIRQLSTDKKRRHGKLNYILLKEIGYGIAESDVDKRIVFDSIKKMVTVN